MIYYLSIGSNIGDKKASLNLALDSIKDIVKVSSTYLTSAVEMEVGSQDFLNLIVEIDTQLDPMEILQNANYIEDQAQRLRPYPNAPRTLDIDLVYSPEITLDTPRLTLPHPRAKERLFVLVPLAELSERAASAVLGRPFLLSRFYMGDYDHEFIGQRISKYCDALGHNSIGR